MKLLFTDPAVKAISKLPPKIARRIVKKMQWFAEQDDPLSFAKPLSNQQLGSHRFRVGDYRILVEIDKGTISILVVLSVKHRKDVYNL